ncbi:MAG: hypothetical protein BWK79_05735, partial [Beggiatoa sp. IS2]
ILMMNDRTLKILLTTYLIGYTISAFGEFDLFEANRGQPKVVAPPTPPPQVFKPPTPPPVATPPPQPLKPPPPQQDFSLRGTSRIGKNLSAVLQAPDGKQIVQRLDGQRTEVKGYAGYFLVQVNAREIQIEYPKESPCQNDNEPKGVYCSKDKKTATLKLPRLNALAAPPPPKAPPVVVQNQPNNPFQPQPGQPQPGQAQPAQQTPFGPMPFGQPQRQLTPEEIKERQEKFEQRKELYKNFKKQEIKDEDVPPGMRVVRTPFGDRLIPDNRTTAPPANPPTNPPQ